MTTHTFTIKSAATAGEIAAALEVAGLKLHADQPGDTVHGSVTVAGSTCVVEIYDAAQAANAEHRTTFAKPLVVPTKLELQAKLQAAGHV